MNTPYTLVVYAAAQLAPSIGVFTIPVKTYGDSPFTITEPTSDSIGGFTYSSSNTGISTISGEILTIVGAGSVTITGLQAAIENYSSGSISTIFHVDSGVPLNIIDINSDGGLDSFMESNNRYGEIDSEIRMDEALVSSGGIKVLVSDGSGRLIV